MFVKWLPYRIFDQSLSKMLEKQRKLEQTGSFGGGARLIGGGRKFNWHLKWFTFKVFQRISFLRYDSSVCKLSSKDGYYTMKMKILDVTKLVEMLILQSYQGTLVLLDSGYIHRDRKDRKKGGVGGGGGWGGGKAVCWLFNAGGSQPCTFVENRNRKIPGNITKSTALRSSQTILSLSLQAANGGETKPGTEETGGGGGEWLPAHWICNSGQWFFFSSTFVRHFSFTKSLAVAHLCNMYIFGAHQ